jgi:hypothetical protein
LARNSTQTRFGDGQGDMSLDPSIILPGHKDVKGELSRPLRLAAQPSRLTRTL